MFKWLKGLFRREPAYAASGPAPTGGEEVPMPKCEHPKSEKPTVIVVRGQKIECGPSAEICPQCTEAWLEKASTTCAKCGGPIVPGAAVGQAWIGAKYPYTHLTFDCCDTGAYYCGVWGSGRLITLHELDPEKYPPGTGSVLSHAAKTGKSVIESPHHRSSG